MADPLVTSPIPGEGSYAQADVLATNAYNNALARINQQRQSTLQQYGYQGAVDPTNGTISGVHVDPNNPYGNLQQLLRGAAQQSMQDQMANQERGITGGLANQALTNDKYAFGGQSAQLGSALTDALSGLQDQQSTAGYTRDSALWQAEQAAATQAIQGGDFNTPSYDGVKVPDYGSGNDVLPQTKPPNPYRTPRPTGNPRAQKIIRQTAQQRLARSRALNRRRPG